MGNRGVVDAFCGRLKWVSLSTLSSEVKVLSALAGGVFHLQQLLEEMEHSPFETRQFVAVTTGGAFRWRPFFG